MTQQVYVYLLPGDLVDVAHALDDIATHAEPEALEEVKSVEEFIDDVLGNDEPTPA